MSHGVGLRPWSVLLARSQGSNLSAGLCRYIIHPITPNTIGHGVWIGRLPELICSDTMLKMGLVPR